MNKISIVIDYCDLLPCDLEVLNFLGLSFNKAMIIKGLFLDINFDFCCLPYAFQVSWVR